MTTLTVLVGSIHNAVEVTNYDRLYFLTVDGVLLLKNNCPLVAVNYEAEAVPETAVPVSPARTA